MKKDHGLPDSRAARLDSDGKKPQTCCPGNKSVRAAPQRTPSWATLGGYKASSQLRALSGTCICLQTCLEEGSVTHRNDYRAHQQPLDNWTEPCKRKSSLVHFIGLSHLAPYFHCWHPEKVLPTSRGDLPLSLSLPDSSFHHPSLPLWKSSFTSALV